MELTNSQYLTLFYFITMSDNLLGRSVKDMNVFSTRNCTYSPSNIHIPCVQYSASTIYGGDCEQDKLKQQFQSLYKVEDLSGASSPGKILDLNAYPESIQWKPPKDGSVRFLKGFYVELLGNSDENFGRKLCTIIDLSNMNETNKHLLINMTFTLQVSEIGAFFVTVDPLPLAPNNPERSQADKPAIPMEYHPQFYNQSIEYYQLNATSINMTVVLKPALENVDRLLLDVYDEHLTRLGNLPDTIPYSMPYYILDGFSEGNYTLRVIIYDNYPGDPSRCVCYKGTIRTRVCDTCRPIIAPIQVDRFETPVEPSDIAETSPATTIGIVTAATLFVVTILVIVVYIAARRMGITLVWFSTFKRTSKSVLVSNAPKQRIFVMFASDHTAHVKTVKTFIEVLRSVACFEITPISLKPSLLTSSSSLYPGEVDECVNVEQADVIMIIHSDWAKALYENMEMETVYTPDGPSKEDCSFISCMHQMKQNTSYRAKLVSARFEYTSPSSIMDMAQGPVFSIPCELNQFIACLYSKSDVKSQAFVKLGDQNTEILQQAIKTCTAYQQKNHNWLAKKMFILKTYVSSDNCGMVSHRKISKLSKSLRSRSADTVSLCMCNGDDHFSQLNDCCLLQTKRHRTLSCDFSFSPPELEREDQSVRYSLLEHKFVAINERYEYFLNYMLKTDEDCLTIDGKSV